jgi:hypothetical protein
MSLFFAAQEEWIPASAGMTHGRYGNAEILPFLGKPPPFLDVIPAKAGILSLFTH